MIVLTLLVESVELVYYFKELYGEGAALKLALWFVDLYEKIAVNETVALTSIGGRPDIFLHDECGRRS